MATRSAIGVAYGDVIKAVYCHWDGYVSNNGRILQENYDRPTASNLIALGDISSLRPEIGVEHPFSRFDSEISDAEYQRLYGDMTTFFHRDRGEENAKDWKVFDTAEQFVEHFDGCGCEYFYIMGNDNEWYVNAYNKGWQKLSQALAEEAAMADQ